MLRDLLRQEGTQIGRLHVATLMKQVAIEATSGILQCKEATFEPCQKDAGSDVF